MKRTEDFDLLLGTAVGLARTADRVPGDEETRELLKEALGLMFPERTSGGEAAGKDAGAAGRLAERIREKKARILPDCTVCRTPCGRFFDYDPDDFWLAREETREAKTRILEMLGELHSRNRTDGNWDLIFRALFAVGEDCQKEWLRTIAEELESVLYCPDRQ